MHLLSKISIAFTFSACATCAQAVEYTMPDDGDWYQLQDAVTYQEYCSSLFASCDVPAGNYFLINHSVSASDSRHRQSITISDGKTNIQSRLESTMITQDCVNGYPGRPEQTDDQPCVATCPSGTTVTGGNCRATHLAGITQYDLNGNTIGVRDSKIIVPTYESLADEGYACELDFEFDYSPYLDQDWHYNNFSETLVRAQAVCSWITE